MGTKGVWQRKRQVSNETFAERWAAIFGQDIPRKCKCGADMVEVEGDDGKTIKVCRKQMEDQGWSE